MKAALITAIYITVFLNLNCQAQIEESLKTLPSLPTSKNHDQIVNKKHRFDKTSKIEFITLFWEDGWMFSNREPMEREKVIDTIDKQFVGDLLVLKLVVPKNTDAVATFRLVNEITERVDAPVELFFGNSNNQFSYLGGYVKRVDGDRKNWTVIQHRADSLIFSGEKVNSNEDFDAILKKVVRSSQIANSEEILLDVQYEKGTTINDLLSDIRVFERDFYLSVDFRTLGSIERAKHSKNRISDRKSKRPPIATPKFNYNPLKN